MNPDDVKETWRTQPAQSRLTVDADLLVQELRRNQQHFAATIFWRDVREVGTGLVMVPLWIILGIKLSLPWAWYLMVPALLWVAGYMLADRMRNGRPYPELGEPLRQSALSSLAEVEHQIRLLRSVLWWYLLPLALPGLIFLGQIAWQFRDGGWWTVLFFWGLVLVGVIAFGAIHRLNQAAVRSSLIPRLLELEALLASLQDETA